MTTYNVLLSCGHRTGITKIQKVRRCCQKCGTRDKVDVTHVRRHGVDVPIAEYRAALDPKPTVQRQVAVGVVVPAELLEATRQKMIDKGWTRELVEKYVTSPYEPLDDAGYQPEQIDSVLRGVARATGATTAAVRKGRTLTRTQHVDYETRRP